MDDVVENRGRIGGLAVDAEAIGADPARAVDPGGGKQDRDIDADRDDVRAQRHHGGGGAGGVELHGVERLGHVGHVLVIGERAGDILETAELADRLQFLAVLILRKLSQAVAGELRIGREDRA